MKKTILMLIGAVAVSLSMASCGGHSTANKEQISNAKEAAAEMLNEINTNNSEPVGNGTAKSVDTSNVPTQSETQISETADHTASDDTK